MHCSRGCGREGGVNREEKKWRICITSVIRSDISGLSWTHRKHRGPVFLHTSWLWDDINHIKTPTFEPFAFITAIGATHYAQHQKHVDTPQVQLPFSSSTLGAPLNSIPFSCQRRNSCSRQRRLKNDPFSESSKCAGVTWREARVRASESHSQEGIDVGLFLVRQMRIWDRVWDDYTAAKKKQRK